MQSERELPGFDVTAERAERLSDFLALSYEPMFAWQLDGPIEFWNAGAERLYGYAPDEAIRRSSHSLLQTKFPIEFAEIRSQLRREHYWSGELRHVWMAAKSSSTAGCSCTAMTSCSKSIMTQPTVSNPRRRYARAKPKLARELADTKLLHSISVEMMLEQSIDALYQKL